MCETGEAEDFLGSFAELGLKHIFTLNPNQVDNDETVFSLRVIKIQLLRFWLLLRYFH